MSEVQAPTDESATQEAPAVAEEAPAVESKADRAEVEKLFRFSGFVHVGPGAADCEDGEDGSCGDPLHFHAWCRLPNKFQMQAIRTKAQAAKARCIRRLKDPESDANAILEGDLEAIREAGKEALVEEVLSRTYWRDHLAAMKELVEEDESPFATIEEDQARFKELTAMPEDERPTDEYDELVRHLDKWNEEVDRVRGERQRPQRESLEAQTEDELLDLIRNERIKAEADQEYMTVYSAEEWATCTLKPRPQEKGAPNEKVFGSSDHMKQEAPEVIAALEAMFSELEGEFATRAAVRAEGNS
jgi:hypothetical protein